MSDDPYGSVPLFQELQRLLTSSSGPVNWDLARQVAVAGAIGERGDPPAIGDLTEAVRIAELHVHQLTDIEPPTTLPDVRVIRRSTWVAEAMSLLPPLVEPAASRVAEGFEQLQPEADEEEALTQPAGPFGAMDMTKALGAIMALMQGIQTGTVVGTMGATSFASYDLAIPRSDATLSFVEPTISAFEKDWSLPSIEFRQWVAVREVALRAALSRPWTADHLMTLVTDAATNMEVDLTELQGRMERLDMLGNPNAMQELVDGGDSLFDPVMDDEQRLKVARVRAFIAGIEGYGAHVTDSVAERMFGASTQIQEAVRRVDRGAAHLFPRLLGIELTTDHLELGRRFCDTVASQTDETVLSRMWDDADSLPSMPELEEPLLWMARMA